MKTSYGDITFMGIGYGMWGDIIGREYEAAFMYLLANKDTERMKKFYIPLAQALRECYPFSTAKDKWKEITGQDLLWESLQRFLVRNVHYRFSDDTVLTAATIEALTWTQPHPFAAAYRKFGRKYSNAGFGSGFKNWFRSERAMPPYGAKTNGSAMRVSPIGYLPIEREQLLELATLSAEVTHNSPEGILGAQIVVETLFLIRRKGMSIHEAADTMLNEHFRSQHHEPDIAPFDKFEYECLPSVRHCMAIMKRHHHEPFEGLMRAILSYGGDVDTFGMICGCIHGANKYHTLMPSDLMLELQMSLPDEFMDMVHR